MNVEIILRINGVENLIEYQEDATTLLALIGRLPSKFPNGQRHKFTHEFIEEVVCVIGTPFKINDLIRQMQKIGWKSRGNPDTYPEIVRGALSKNGAYKYDPEIEARYMRPLPIKH